MSTYQPPQEPLRLHYVDDAIIVVIKPAGLLSVPGRGPDKQDCVIHRVQQDFPQAQIAHRLDMSTSGLLVVARDAAMQQVMYRLFRERAVEKRYIALVAGVVTPESGAIDLPLICDWPNRPRQMVCFERGKPSQTLYEVLVRDPLKDETRVALTPVTGRSHQLRVHMLALGHPMLGDPFYGDADSQARAPRLLLHAEALSLPHPVSGERVHWACAAPF